MKSKQTSLRDVSMIAHGTAVHKRGHFGGEGGMGERLKCFTADTVVPPMQVPVQKALFFFFYKVCEATSLSMYRVMCACVCVASP